MLENGDEEHGTSVHFVTDELDGGPVILQAKVPVFDGDTEDDITERVQSQEHAIYPLVVSWFVDGRLAMRDGAAWLDGVKLPRRVTRPKSSLFCRVAQQRLPDQQSALPDIPFSNLLKSPTKNNCHTFLALLDISWKCSP